MSIAANTPILSKSASGSDPYSSYGRDTIDALGGHQSHIAELLASLEEKNIDPLEVQLIKATTTALMENFENERIQDEMRDILYSIQSGTLTAAQIHSMMADNKKSEFALRAATIVKKMLDKQFESLINLVDTVESGAPISRDALDDMFKEMNVVMDAVNSIEQVMVLPASKVKSAVQDVETSMKNTSKTILSKPPAQMQAAAGQSSYHSHSSSHGGHGRQRDGQQQSPHGAGGKKSQPASDAHERAMQAIKAKNKSHYEAEEEAASISSGETHTASVTKQVSAAPAANASSTSQRRHSNAKPHTGSTGGHAAAANHGAQHAHAHDGYSEKGRSEANSAEFMANFRNANQSNANTSETASSDPPEEGSRNTSSRAPQANVPHLVAKGSGYSPTPSRKSTVSSNNMSPLHSPTPAPVGLAAFTSQNNIKLDASPSLVITSLLSSAVVVNEEVRMAHDVYKKISTLTTGIAEEEKNNKRKEEEITTRAVDLNKRTDRLIVREHELETRTENLNNEVEDRVAAKVHNAIEQVIHRTIASNDDVARGRSRSPQAGLPRRTNTNDTQGSAPQFSVNVEDSPKKATPERGRGRSSSPERPKSNSMARANMAAVVQSDGPPSNRPPSDHADAIIGSIQQQVAYLSRPGTGNDGSTVVDRRLSDTSSATFDDAFGNETVQQYTDQAVASEVGVTVVSDMDAVVATAAKPNRVFVSTNAPQRLEMPTESAVPNTFPLSVEGDRVSPSHRAPSRSPSVTTTFFDAGGGGRLQNQRTASPQHRPNSDGSASPKRTPSYQLAKSSSRRGEHLGRVLDVDDEFADGAHAAEDSIPFPHIRYDQPNTKAVRNPSVQLNAGQLLVIAPSKKVDRGTNTYPMEEKVMMARSRTEAGPATQGEDSSSKPPENKNDGSGEAMATDSSAVLHIHDVSQQDPLALRQATMTASADSSGKKHLPIVAQSEFGLVTRTYKEDKPVPFEEQLAASTDPTLLLYRTYNKHLPELHKARMLNALFNFGEEIPNQKLNDMFGLMLPQVVSIEKSCGSSIEELLVCEDIAKTLGVLLLNIQNAALASTDGPGADVPTSKNDMKLFKKSLEQLKWRIGEADFLQVWASIQLNEFRAVMQKLNAAGRDTLKKVLLHCPNARECFDKFYSCQAKLGEMAMRLETVNSCIIRYRLPMAQYYQSKEYHGHPDPTTAFGARPASKKKPKFRGTDTGLAQGLTRAAVSPGPTSPDEGEAAVIAFKSLFNNEAESKMKTSVQILEKKLDEAYGEIDELNVENFKLSQEKDRTPAALAFYASLYDPGLVVAMQQLSQQLTNLRGVIDCSKHFDFVMLRKRLQVCVNAVPVVDRFVEKYDTLHKQWTKIRYNTFIARKQIGGDADGSLVCPMCTFDWRNSTYFGPGGASPKGATGTTANLALLQNSFSTKALVDSITTRNKKSKKSTCGLELGSTVASTGSKSFDDSQTSQANILPMISQLPSKS